MSTQLLSTYHMFPNDEEQMGDTAFWQKNSMNVFDYLNLIFYGGGAVLFFYYFTSSFDSIPKAILADTVSSLRKIF